MRAREGSVAGELHWGLDAGSLALDGGGVVLGKRRENSLEK